MKRKKSPIYDPEKDLAVKQRKLYISEPEEGVRFQNQKGTCLIEVANALEFGSTRCFFAMHQNIGRAEAHQLVDLIHEYIDRDIVKP